MTDRTQFAFYEWLLLLHLRRLYFAAFSQKGFVNAHKIFLFLDAEFLEKNHRKITTRIQHQTYRK